MAYAHHVHRGDSIALGAGVQREPAYGLATMISVLSWLVGLAGIAVLGLLGMRLAFQAGSANPTDFVHTIYDISSPLVQPFQGIADARSVGGGGTFQPEIVIAMGAYFVATVLVMLTMLALAATAASPAERPVVHRTHLARGSARLLHGH